MHLLYFVRTFEFLCVVLLLYDAYFMFRAYFCFLHSSHFGLHVLDFNIAHLCIFHGAFRIPHSGCHLWQPLCLLLVVWFSSLASSLIPLSLRAQIGTKLGDSRMVPAVQRRRRDRSNVNGRSANPSVLVPPGGQGHPLGSEGDSFRAMPFGLAGENDSVPREALHAGQGGSTFARVGTSGDVSVHQAQA